MQSQTPELSLQEIKLRLRDASLKATTARVQVIRALKSCSVPVTHAELVDLLADTGLDRATIYRNLIDLTKVGLLSRRDLGDHVWRFELCWQIQEQHQHPHFCCVTCGQVRCLPDVRVDISSNQPSYHAMNQHNVEIQLRGRCDQC